MTRVRRPVAILLSRFPLITETFILREIIELERQGQPVLLVPMIREHPSVVHEEARPWIARALFTPWISLAIVTANLRALVRKPAAIARLLWWIVAGSVIRPGTLARSLALFPKSVYLAEVLEQEGVRHLHAHFATHPTTMARIISELAGLSYSFTVHAHDIFVERTLLREKIRDARFIRSISQFNRHFLESLYPRESAGKIDVVHVGIPVEMFIPVERRTAGEPRLLCVAALKPYKGVQVLVEACALLAREGTAFRCDIIGDGPLRSHIRRVIVRNALHGRVSLRGALPQHVVASQMTEADIVVLPSIVASNNQMEGIPVALMEAMAAGKPVIATAISGIPELVHHDVSGILVDPANPRLLADAIGRLISDSSLRDRLGRRGRAIALAEFDLRKCVRDLLRVLDEHNGSHDDAVVNVIERIASNGFAYGVTRIHRGRDADVFEVSRSQDGIVQEIVVKQHLSRDGESRPPRVRAVDEARLLSELAPHFAAADAPLSVPRAVHLDEPSATVVMSRVEGEPLTELMRRARGAHNGEIPLLHEAVRSAGAWLAHFQSFERSSAAKAIEDLAIRAQRDARAVGAPQRVMDRVDALRESLSRNAVSAVSHHGDFWPGNVFFDHGSISVVDLEGYGLSLPAHDIAYFLLHASLYFAFRPRRLMDVVREAFFEGYKAPLDPAELELCRLATALQLAARDRMAGGNPLHHLVHRRIVYKELSR